MNVTDKPNRFQRFARRVFIAYTMHKFTLGHLLCLVGRHKWQPVKGTQKLDWRSKWEQYMVAKGICVRPGCSAKADIQRDHYY